jgi:hypothetical protein
MLNAMSTNWKTTALGVCGLLTSLGSLGGDILSGNFTTLATLLPAIAASLGLMFAKDAK